MSDLLREFLTAWLDWAEGDADPRGQYGAGHFHRDCGLCYNSVEFSWDRGRKGYPEAYVLEDELRAIYAAEGRNKDYPFGKEGYDRAEALNSMHKDPARLAWVRKQLEAA
jgi:hypothetical protein